MTRPRFSSSTDAKNLRLVRKHTGEFPIAPQKVQGLCSPGQSLAEYVQVIILLYFLDCWIKESLSCCVNHIRIYFEFTVSDVMIILLRVALWKFLTPDQPTWKA